MDARTFLGMEPDGDELHWRMDVTPQLTTPGNFLFGGCGLGAALVALEAASGRPTVWATAQYLSYALTDTELRWEVTLAAVGGHVTQGRAVGRVDGREILTVNAASGKDELDVGGVWVEPPYVPPPDECPPRFLPDSSATPSWTASRSARPGRTFEEMDGTPGSPDSALWARVPGHLTPSAATLAIFGDYVSGAVSQPIGRRAMGEASTTPSAWCSSSRPSGCSATSACTPSSAGTPRASPSCGPRTGNSWRRRASRSVYVSGPRTPSCRVRPGVDLIAGRNGETVRHGPPRESARGGATVRQGRRLSRSSSSRSWLPRRPSSCWKRPPTSTSPHHVSAADHAAARHHHDVHRSADDHDDDPSSPARDSTPATSRPSATR